MEDAAVIKESEVFDVAELVGIDVHNGLHFLVVDVNTEESSGLLELLWANLEMVVSILVLEE